MNPKSHNSTVGSAPKSAYEERRIQREKTKKKLFILIGIGILFLILFIIILYASIKKGGIQNLIQGDGNVVSNTIDNINDAISGGTSGTNNSNTNDPNAVQKFDTLPPIPTTYSLNNLMVFSDVGTDYGIEIKKNSYITFRNSGNVYVQLEFSDGRDLSLRNNEEQTLYFTNVGSITFRDPNDSSALSIKGTITVIN